MPMMKPMMNPLIEAEKKMADKLYLAMNGDVIEQVIARAGMNHKDDTMLRVNYEVNKMKVLPEVMPDLYRLLQSVPQRLGFLYPVEFYITPSKVVNACTKTQTTPGKPLIIEIYSELIELMSAEEICFVVGHELGHRIAGHDRLTNLINFIFPEGAEAMPKPLHRQIMFWKQLCELVADRFGYLAVGNLESCVSSFCKLQSGLSMKNMQLDVRGYIDYNMELLSHYAHGELRSLDSMEHPAKAIRIEALRAYAEATDEDEMKDYTADLFNMMSHIARKPVDIHLACFMASAGLYLAKADHEVTDSEREFILTNISNSFLFPMDVFTKISAEDPMQMIEKSYQKIMELRPDLQSTLFDYLMDQTMVDHRLHIEEVNRMTELAVNLFGYSERMVMRTYAKRIQDNFCPAIGNVMLGDE